MIASMGYVPVEGAERDDRQGPSSGGQAVEVSGTLGGRSVNRYQDR
jgi:hypothetical protein